ncbi:hypothetical protein [Serratia sp. UGAL515B_01]|uniref:hypothetical protein n=1 Tax=Serratia sp. UGAL515B_01 TaxID=2986763 RepID=UPI002953C56E|nr:hypothetical protein [Serratia sp. UGAL515B_01]WON76401.1 hypothetical protein OK023_14410 [Serratia sp. UGAL515B_01]
MKLNSKISIAAVMSAALFSAAASSADFTNITSGSAEINVVEKTVVLMNITPLAGLGSGQLKENTPLASFLASTSSSNGFVAVRWGNGAHANFNIGGVDIIGIPSKTDPKNILPLKLVAPELKHVKDTEWYSNNKSRIDGHVVLATPLDVKAGTYAITLDAASYTL